MRSTRQNACQPCLYGMDSRASQCKHRSIFNVSDPAIAAHRQKRSCSFILNNEEWHDASPELIFVGYVYPQPHMLSVVEVQCGEWKISTVLQLPNGESTLSAFTELSVLRWLRCAEFLQLRCSSR